MNGLSLCDNEQSPAIDFMPSHIWKPLRSEYLFNKDNLVIRRDECKQTTGKIISPCYVLEFPDWVNVFALTGDKQLILVKQYRHAFGDVTIELPGGWIKSADASPEAAVRRELAEETGYTVQQIVRLGAISPNPALNNNLLHMFLATDAIPSSAAIPDEDEEIEIILVPIPEVLQMLKENRLMNNGHVTCVFYALYQLGYLKFELDPM